MVLESTQWIALLVVFCSFAFFGIVRSTVLSSVVLFVSLLFVRILFEPVYFPDYIGYYYYHLALTYYGVDFFGSFEILSKLLFVYAGELIPSINSLTVVHWTVFCISFSLLLVSFFLRRLDQLAFLLMLALVGPIVLMVTMRASIAYALIALFIIRGANLRPLNILILVITPAIHISVLLAIVPLLIYNFVRSKRIRPVVVYRWTVLLIIAGTVLKLASFMLPVYSVMLNMATSVIPNLAKYEVYISSQTSGFHHLYYFIVSALVVWCYSRRDRIHIDIRLLMIMSWIFFAMGPVAVVAFRYSLFLIIPLIMTISIPKNISHNAPMQFICASACAGFFILHLLSLYDVYI